MCLVSDGFDMVILTLVLAAVLILSGSGTVSGRGLTCSFSWLVVPACDVKDVDIMLAQRLRYPRSFRHCF